jgi:hypothetical protein
MNQDEAKACAKYLIGIYPTTTQEQATLFARRSMRYERSRVMKAIDDTHVSGFAPFERIYAASARYAQSYQPTGDIAELEARQQQASEAWAKLDRAQRIALIESVTKDMPDFIRNIELGLASRDVPSRLLWRSLGVQ